VRVVDSVLHDERIAARLRASAAQLARPDAAERVAARLAELAQAAIAPREQEPAYNGL